MTLYDTHAGLSQHSLSKSATVNAPERRSVFARQTLGKGKGMAKKKKSKKKSSTEGQAVEHEPEPEQQFEPEPEPGTEPEPGPQPEPEQQPELSEDEKVREFIRRAGRGCATRDAQKYLQRWGWGVAKAAGALGLRMAPCSRPVW